jgi:hypothetical protein
MKARSIALFLTVLLLSFPAGLAMGADTPAPQQGPGEHSTIVTSDGSIRDDELADYIAQQVAANPNGPKDVKVFLNTCYGGGLLDDLERVFGPGGAAAGTPWVAGSAAGADECAWCPTDESVGNSGAGGWWTDALLPGMTVGGNVAGGINNANANDAAGANGAGWEHGVMASGNGGDGITWSPKSQVVTFAGKPDYQADDNDVDNVNDAMLGVNGGDPSSDIRTSATGSRSTNDLKQMIANAAAACDSETQLVLYFSDHGDTHFDFDEWFAAMFGGGFMLVDPLAGGLTLPFSLHPGWLQGLMNMDMVPDQTANPFVELTPLDSIFDNEWEILLNGQPLPLPFVVNPGETIELPVDWWTLLDGENVLEIVPIGDPIMMDPLEFEGAELSSGDICRILGELAGPVPGDANGDGMVTDADYTIWADNYGLPGDPSMGDFNGDGFISDADYTIWADNYGAGVPVPEPCSLAVLLVGFGLLRRRT